MERIYKKPSSIHHSNNGTFFPGEQTASARPRSFFEGSPVIQKKDAASKKSSEALYIAFPDFKIDTETVLGKVGGLGHAGVVLINEKGSTRYYEYGRYATKDGTKGRVRKVTVPDVTIGADGKATPQSLEKLLTHISKTSGQGGKIDAAYFINVDFDVMDAYARKKLKESNPEYKEYDKKRKSYDLLNNNCGTFAEAVVTQDKSVDKPSIYDTSPTNIVEEYQEEGNARVTFDPKKKKDKLAIGKSDEDDAKVKD